MTRNALLISTLFLASCALFEAQETISPDDAGSSVDDMGGTASDGGNPSTPDSGVDAGMDATIIGCGNGKVEDGEECDDGNLRSRDGCSSRCTNEMLAWTEIQPTFERSRYDFGMTDSFFEDVVVFGGRTGPDSAPLDDTLRWNEIQNRWDVVQVTSKPPAMDGLVMGSITGQGVFIFGGRRADGSLSNETWRFERDEWQRLSPAQSPPARIDAAMGELEDGRLIMFGGFDGSTVLDDLWIFNGTEWSEVSRTGADWPAARRKHAMAQFEGAIVLFGGYSDDPSDPFGSTWLYSNASQSWSLSTSTSRGPSSRSGHMMTSDRDGLFLFGGQDSETNVSDELWEWDGSWNLIDEPGSASMRRDGGMANSDRGGVIIFGGRVATVPRGDVWTYGPVFDGWKQQLGGEWPPEREDFGMVTRLATGELVLFGGESSRSENSFDDTWIWDSTSGWREVLGAGFPERTDFSAAYHQASDQIFMHGGVVGTSSAPEQTDTWSFDGETWSLVNTGGSALGIQDSAMEYHPGLETLFMYGGERSGGYSSSLYRWNAGSWVEVSGGPVQPERRSIIEMEWDANNDGLLVFGGYDGELLDDHLFYADDNWTAVEANPRPGPRASFGMSRFVPSGQIVVHGGSSPNGDRDDLWIWDGESWSIQTVALRPEARGDHELAWSPSARGVVLFGGYALGGGSSNAGDMWLLQYGSSVVDELCVDAGVGLDEDGDGLTDCDDPDCAYVCDQ